MALELTTVQEQVERFMTDTLDARVLSEKCRDYFDHKQWTEAEARKLQSRNQAPIVVNRIRPKVKGLVGLYNIRKSDPKAFPRTKKHEKSSHAITDALRYVTDNNDFSQIRLNVAEEFFVEGYSGAAVVVEENKRGEPEILITEIPWDRIYFDPHSRKKDFSDARYIGFYMWMYSDEAKEKFPDADIDQLIASSDYYTDETTEDRPRWFDKQRDRIRIAVHFCIYKAQWYMSVFTEGQFLIKPEISPYLDDDGEPCCVIELVSANLDRDNQRYGEVLGFLDQQDEINHRRSKALHLLNQRQTFGRKGEVPDVKALKRELAKPDGHVEFIGEKFGVDFGVIPTDDKLRGQFELYQDAKAELDSVSYNAQLAGERQQGDLSGVAIGKLQSAGTVELNQDYELLFGWEKRIYRQIWGRVKQYWKEEKWIRITDDQDNLRWVGLNSQMSVREFLEDKIQDKSVPFPERKKFAASYQYLTQLEQGQDMQAAELASAQLERFIAVNNPVAELDADIILDQSFDVINIQQEQFELLVQFAQGSDIDIIELIELSQLRGKEELIDKIEKRRQQAAQAQEGAAQMQQAMIQAELQEKQANVQAKQAEIQIKAREAQTKDSKVQAEINKLLSEAQQIDLESLLLIAQPKPDSVKASTSVVI